MTVEWDERKAAANLKKHRIAFEDAATVFLDPLAITFPDPDHSAAGNHSRLYDKEACSVHFPLRTRGRIRIISARLAT